MVKKTPPANLTTGPPFHLPVSMDRIVSYAPSDDKISTWHTVSSPKDSFYAIAKRYDLPVATIIAFNFPGSVKNDRVDPDVVNWYLYNHQRFNCRGTTVDRMNYVFRGGEKVAIPWRGSVKVEDVEIHRSWNTKFKIKMHANLNVSAVVAGDFSIFEIWDQKANLCSFYTYWAGGVAGGAIPGAWLSATLAGPWNDFTVNQAMGANQFTGPTRFTTGGGGSASKNFINFMGLPKGTHTNPNPLPINTGFTIGIGAGTSVGRMRLELVGEPDGLLPRKTP